MRRFIRRRYYQQLWARLHSQPRLLQVVVGPRQVGKTTLALQLLARWEAATHYETADQPSTPTADWIIEQWEHARRLPPRGRRADPLLVLDEIQKVPRWSEVVKRLLDEDRRHQRRLRVVLLGSSALLMQRGLGESLAGRFELHRHPQWSFPECRACFGVSLDAYLYFGGYPGALALRRDEARWAAFIRDALIETVLSRDVLLVAPVAKPALLRQLFGLAVAHPAEILSYQKMLGTLQDAGNTTTLAAYLRLLSQAFLVVPLERFSGSRVKQRGSIPKLLVLDNALVTAMQGRGFRSTRRDAGWGRLVENAVGAHLYWPAQTRGLVLQYWRDRHDEVDYVLSQGARQVSVEVKAGLGRGPSEGWRTFRRRYPASRACLISTQRAPRAAPSLRPVSTEQFFRQEEPLRLVWDAAWPS